MDLDPTIEKLQAMVDGFLAHLPNLVLAIIVFVLLYIFSGTLRRSVRRLAERSRRGAYAGRILGRLVQWATIIFAMMVAISIVFPSLSAQTLIGILGLSSLAIGFAFRDIAENFLAGILILITQPFKLGDQIVVDDFEGTVQTIEVRATNILTYDGRIVVIPNADLLTNAVIVNTAHPIRRSQYDVGIAYGSDIDHAKELILNAVRDVRAVLDSPGPDVLTVELADSSVNLRARWWTDSTRSTVVRSTDEVITNIKKALDAGGIEIPFPVRTVYFSSSGDGSGEIDGGPA